MLCLRAAALQARTLFPCLGLGSAVVSEQCRAGCGKCLHLALWLGVLPKSNTIVAWSKRLCLLQWFLWMNIRVLGWHLALKYHVSLCVCVCATLVSSCLAMLARYSWRLSGTSIVASYFDRPSLLDQGSNGEVLLGCLQILVG